MKKKIKMAIVVISMIAFIVIIAIMMFKGENVETNTDKNRNIETNTENITNDILLLDEKQKIKNEVATTEIPEITSADEEILEPQEVDSEEFEAQGDTAYINRINSFVDIQLGEKIGLTYYSQVDSRWKNIMYSSRGDSNQTIGSSGCGPTAAAIVVTSIKGIITPPEMAELYVRYRI